MALWILDAIFLVYKFNDAGRKVNLDVLMIGLDGVFLDIIMKLKDFVW